MLAREQLMVNKARTAGHAALEPACIDRHSPALTAWACVAAPSVTRFERLLATHGEPNCFQADAWQPHEVQAVRGPLEVAAKAEPM